MRRIIAYKHYFQEFMERLTEEQRKRVKEEYKHEKELNNL